jgi:hypothetical protein
MGWRAMAKPTSADAEGIDSWKRFERAVDAAVKGGPMHKIGKCKAKTNQKASPPQGQLFIELFEELRLLLKQSGGPRSAADSILQLLQHLDKCLRVKFAYETAARTGKATLILEPSDTFLRFMSAFRTYDWPLVSIIEHEICSSSAEKRAPSA